MEFIQAIRVSIGDAFTVLPILIIGFIFFLGTLTSNTGLLYLFAGHILLVPALSFLSNAKGRAWFDDNDKFDLFKGIRWAISMTLFLSINLSSNSASGYFGFLALVPLIGQFIANAYGNKVTPFYFANPIAWFTRHEPSIEGQAVCSMVPGIEPKDVYTMPSDWLTHITFFCTFVFTNAYVLFNQPVPQISSNTPSESISTAKATLNQRVTNRKWVSAAIMAMTVLVYLILLAFRLNKTGCEASIIYTLVPLLLTGLTATSFFYFITNSCGILPTDILGVAQGMIPSNLINNPIVCVGS